MSLTWSTTGQIAHEGGIKVCVHGRPKVGKTRLIATTPRPLILSAEKGTLSIAEYNIPLIQIDSLNDLTEAYDWLKSSHDAKSFDTICLDSISEIGEKLLSEEKAKNNDPRKYYPEYQDKISIQIRKFRDLIDKNTYFIAKTELAQQPDGTTLYSPAMPGKKVGPGLAYFFDEIFFIEEAEYDQIDPSTGEVKKIRYEFLNTHTTPQFEAGDRSGALEAKEKADLTHVFNKIRARLKMSQ